MLEILCADNYLAAVNKPPGLLVHRTGLDAGETRFALQMLRDQLGRPVWPVHRLDKGTSGVLLFALDAQTAGVL
ncbi:MAG: pseudouridine synthase, partial [Comamonadaceae bacterium]|nr:pseudouridine synthase [Comamonadaceae bacterium]